MLNMFTKITLLMKALIQPCYKYDAKSIELILYSILGTIVIAYRIEYIK